MYLPPELVLAGSRDAFKAEAVNITFPSNYLLMVGSCTSYENAAPKIFLHLFA